jgi:hypothetical protein
MAIRWHRIFGRFSARQDFADGTYIVPTSRESLGVFAGKDVIDVEFLYDAKKGEHVYYLPKNLSETARPAAMAKIHEYARRKRLRLREG